MQTAAIEILFMEAVIRMTLVSKLTPCYDRIKADPFEGLAKDAGRNPG